jgi:predicted GIY-YIG superfamily endonuclease
MTGTPSKTPEEQWYVYIVECRDGSLYTGVTNDLDRRVHQHNDGTASRYTRSRRPVALRYSEPAENRSAALIRECAVKLMSPVQKRALLESGSRRA